MKNKSLDYYLALPYKVYIYPEEDGSGYTAVIPDLPGCMTSADTINELWEMLEEAKHLWIEVAIEHDEFIPEPAPIEEEEYSGKFVVRLPRSLHRQLAVRADHEDTSLNQLVVMLLSEGMGRWHETRDHISEYTKFFKKYAAIYERDLSGLYSQVITLLVEPRKEREGLFYTWDPKEWSFIKRDKTRISGHG